MTKRFLLSFVFFLISICALGAPLAPTVPAAAQSSAHFDSLAATNAWLASVPAAARARSDAYFEGGYWLILWDFLYGLAVMLLFLQTKLSTRMRELAERLTRLAFFQIFLYWCGFSVVTAVLTFPLTVWEGFVREHNYGLSNQDFSGWFGEQMIGLALNLILGGLAVGALFAIVRRLPKTWQLWGAVAATVFLLFGAVVAPVYIAPLFNTYKPLGDAAIKARILNLAHANGIPATDVYQVDASKQSKRVSANVSGLLGTERITLNDNLLARCSPQAVLSTMGHEMGHYVLHHIYIAVLFFMVSAFVFFQILRFGITAALARWGQRWGIRGIGDPAVIPLAVIILSVLGLLYTPIGNTVTRTQEFEADLYGLNAARQPDGEAEVDLLLGEYRKLDPSPLEEFVFFDHPSGRTRIHAAMRWKAENLCLFDASLPCGNGAKHLQ